MAKMTIEANAGTLRVQTDGVITLEENLLSEVLEAANRNPDYHYEIEMIAERAYAKMINSDGKIQDCYLNNKWLDRLFDDAYYEVVEIAGEVYVNYINDSKGEAWNIYSCQTGEWFGQMGYHYRYKLVNVAGHALAKAIDLRDDKVKDIYSYETKSWIGRPRHDHYETKEVNGQAYAFDVSDSNKSQDAYSFEINKWIGDVDSIC